MALKNHLSCLLQGTNLLAFTQVYTCRCHPGIIYYQAEFCKLLFMYQVSLQKMPPGIIYYQVEFCKLLLRYQVSLQILPWDHLLGRILKLLPCIQYSCICHSSIVQDHLLPSTILLTFTQVYVEGKRDPLITRYSFVNFCSYIKYSCRYYPGIIYYYVEFRKLLLRY